MRHFHGTERPSPGGGLDMTIRFPDPAPASPATAAGGGGAQGGTGEVTEILEQKFSFGSEDFHVFYLDGAVSADDVVWSWTQSNEGDVVTERAKNVVLILSCFDVETSGTITVTATVGGAVITLVFDPT